MCEADIQSRINIAKSLSKYFAIDLVIKVFGVTICEYHFPPKSD